MIKYWEWLESHHGAKYDLTVSNAPPLKEDDLKEIGVELPKIDFGKCYWGGSPELKQVIAGLYSVAEENVFICNSASDINDIVFDSFIKKGSEILVESPGYSPLLESPKRRAKLRGAKVKRFKRKSEDGFQIDLDGLHKLVNKKTGIIAMTNVHNPSGVKTSEERVKEIGKIAEENNSVLLIDEVYRRHCEGLKSAYPLNESIIATDSLSKYFGATSLRVGWAVGNGELIKKISSCHGYRSVVSCSFSEDLAAALLPYQDFFKQRVKGHYDRNFQLFQDWVGTRDDVSLVKPDGYFGCFPKLAKVKNTIKFADDLMEEYSTLVVPGEMYGLKGHVRLCFSCESAVLEKALCNLGKALDKVQ